MLIELNLSSEGVQPSMMTSYSYWIVISSYYYWMKLILLILVFMVFFTSLLELFTLAWE